MRINHDGSNTPESLQEERLFELEKTDAGRESQKPGSRKLRNS